MFLFISCVLVLLWIVFSNFHQSHSYILIEKHLLVKVCKVNCVLFLFWIVLFFQIFMNHNKNNMWFINWDTFVTLWKFTIEIWQLLTTFSNFRISAIESTTEIRKSCLRTLRVWSGFQYMSSNLLMHSERLERYLIVLLLLHGLQKKELWQKKSWLGRNTKYTKTNL